MARLSEADAVNLVQAHAAICGVSWGSVRVKKQRAWWYLRVVGYAVEVTSDDGTLWAHVPADVPCVVYCDFHPAKPDGVLIPPWLTCPPWVNQVSIHWRMGFGEHYWARWFVWLRTLSRQQQEQYKARFPTTNLAGWEGFWEMREPELQQGEPGEAREPS